MSARILAGLSQYFRIDLTGPTICDMYSAVCTNVAYINLNSTTYTVFPGKGLK
jgi:hypothetical protein